MGDAEKLKITIDCDECIGDGLCVEEAPDTFEMDEDGEKAVVKENSSDDRETIVEAAKSCPTDAITVEDKETGQKLWPED